MKDFLDVSFKGRIASKPEFDTTKEGLLRARFQVAVNRDYKNKNTPSYLSVTYLGADAEYVQKGVQEGIYFQVGCTIMVNHASATVHPIQMTSQSGKQYTSLELDSVSAKTDRTICMEKKVKAGQTAVYQNGVTTQQVYQPGASLQQAQQLNQPYHGYAGYSYQNQPGNSCQAQAGNYQNAPAYNYGMKGGTIR